MFNMRPLILLLGVLLFVNAASAVWLHEVIHYDGPAKRLRGTVRDYSGAPIPFVGVGVYDHPELWDRHSMSMVERRARQKKIASVTADESGRYKIRIRKGVYEVEFMRMGWSTVSVILHVDPNGSDLCMELPISGSSHGQSKVIECR